MLDQHTAEDRAARGGGTDDHAPDTDGHIELLGGERGAQQTERGRHQQRAEEALEHAEDDDESDAVGEADGSGGRGEPGDTYEEGLPVAEAVTELAAWVISATARARK